jgi:integrase
LRDQALLLVGRDLLARASELVALRVEDVQAVEGGAVVALRRRKTDTEARPYFIGPEATEALQAWLRRAGIEGGLLFRSVNKAGKASERGLSTRDVGRTLKARALQAQLPSAAGVSAHSLRTGMACDLVAANLEVSAVMAAGGWSTPSMVARYTAGLAAQRGAVARYYGARR